MLDGYKQIYTECANLIPEWKKLSKTELANLYVENEDKEAANSYFAALMIKHWNLIGHFYYKQGVKTATEEDCYDWLIEGITAALHDKAWLNKDNTLYEDKKGPEKAMMVCIMSCRANFYQYANYDKRKLNYTSFSLDYLEEISSDGFFIPYEDKHFELTDHLKELVVDAFTNKDFFFCFFVDLLFNDNLIQKKEEEEYAIAIRKFNQCIDKVDDDYLRYFAETYELEESAVKKAFTYVKIMPAYRVHSNTSKAINSLRKDTVLRDLLRGE